MNNRYLLVRCELIRNCFTLMELDENDQATGETAKFVQNEELARAVDDLEQQNHCKEETNERRILGLSV